VQRPFAGERFSKEVFSQRLNQTKAAMAAIFLRESGAEVLSIGAIERRSEAIQSAPRTAEPS